MSCTEFPEKAAITSYMNYCPNVTLRYPRMQDQKRWRPIDADFQDGVGSMSLCFCPKRQPIPHLWISATNRHLDYTRCKAKDRWRSVAAHFDILFIQNLLPLIIVFTIVWTYWLPLWLTKTQPFGKAKLSNILALVTLILLNFIYLGKWFISPAILVFINQYSHATSRYSHIRFLQMKSSVKRHKEPGENWLTHSVLLCLFPHFSSFPLHWPSSTPVQPFSSTSVFAKSIREHLVWHSNPATLGVPDPSCHSAGRYWIQCLPPSRRLAHIWIIQVTIPVKPTFCVRNTFSCTIFFTSGWMKVKSFYSVDIKCLSSSSRVVFCRQRWWQRWSFRQFSCSCTFVLKVWLGCFDELFSICNVFDGCHLLVTNTRFLLCIT